MCFNPEQRGVSLLISPMSSVLPCAGLCPALIWQQQWLQLSSLHFHSLKTWITIPQSQSQLWDFQFQESQLRVALPVAASFLPSQAPQEQKGGIKVLRHFAAHSSCVQSSAVFS